MVKCWIDLFMGWSELLAVRYLKRNHKCLKKSVYFLSDFQELQTWLVEVAHVVNGVNL